MVNRSLLFLVKFFLIFAVLHALLYAVPLMPLQHWIAGFEAGMLNLQHEGNSIFIDSVIFQINQSCTGLVSGITLAAVIFALRKPGLRMKLISAAAGTLLLFVLNLARVYLVLSYALQNPAGAELLHHFTWLLTAAAIIAVWYYSTKRIAKIGNFSELL